MSSGSGPTWFLRGKKKKKEFFCAVFTCIFQGL